MKAEKNEESTLYYRTLKRKWTSNNSVFLKLKEKYPGGSGNYKMNTWWDFLIIYSCMSYLSWLMFGYSITALTNIFSQNDAGESGGLRGESLENRSPGAAAAAHLIHSLDTGHLWSCRQPGRTWPMKNGHVHSESRNYTVLWLTQLCSLNCSS